MSTIEMSEEQRYILRLFATGKDAYDIAERLKLPVDVIDRTVTELAGDDQVRAAQLVAAYDAARQGEPAPPPAAVEAKPAPAPAQADARPLGHRLAGAAASRGPVLSRPMSPAPPVTPAAPQPEPEPPRPTPAPGPARTSLLARAASSESARTQGLGRKIQGLLDHLATRLAAEEEERQQRAERAAAARIAAERVAELERQLAEARDSLREVGGRVYAQTRAGTTDTADKDVDPKVVRQWARDNGVECSAMGRPPKSVIAAWRTAIAGGGK